VANLAGLGFAGNGLGQGVISFAMPGLQRDWGLTAVDLGFILPIVGVGQGLGAVYLGRLADRIGRRWAFFTTALIAGVGFGLASMSPNAIVLTACLAFASLGIGGVAPAAGSLVSEFAPAAHRGKLLAWTQVLWAVGWSFAALGGGWFADQLGWRGVMAVGSLPIVTAVLSLLVVPESPRYLHASGRSIQAAELARRLEERHGIAVTVGTASASTGRPPRASELWSQQYRRRTFLLWATWIAMVMAFSGPMVWLPVLLADLGPNVARELSAWVGFSMIPAALISVALIDRSGRQPLMLGSLGAAALGAVLLGVSGSPVVVTIGAVLLAGGTLAAWPVTLAWSAELYPTRMRGTGSGWASGMSRIGGIAAPLLLGTLLGTDSIGREVAMAPFAIVLVVSVVGVAAWGEETAGRTLEELTAERHPAA
jgi:putative MFS transporter